MSANDIRRATTAPSLDLASRLLHDYAELQRASDRMLVSAIDLGVNPNEIAGIVATQREMLGGFLALAVGQVDMLRMIARSPDLGRALAHSANRDAPRARPSYDPDDPDLRDHGHDEMGMP